MNSKQCDSNGVLFIGVYRDGTGWGQSSINHILALDSVGVNVVPRSISLSPPKNVKLPNRILELEKGDISKCNYCIQQVLPEYYVYNSKFKKNIGLLSTETRNIGRNRWIDCCNMMDEIWVHTELSKACLLTGDIHGKSVDSPIIVHGHPTNINANITDKLPLPLDETLFKFYFIGEAIPRKGLKELLLAFHSEFLYNEPVSLTIKLSGQTEEWFNSLSKHVKQQLHIYDDPTHYRKELLITEYLSDYDMERLHNSCDCLVTPSHGEAWSIPSADAICHNNPVILTDSVGVIDKARDACYVVESEPEYRCFSDGPSLDNLTGKEIWSSININRLRQAMRSAYENKELYGKKVEACSKIRSLFSYENVGQQLKESLYA